MSTISRITERINSWTGYCEKASRAYLDDFTANAGSGNYTCFGRDYTELVNDGYDWNGEPWCDMFIDMCFVYEFGVDMAIRLLGGLNAYTPSSANYFKNMNQWHISEPQKGDIIFFKKTNGLIYHVGYVRGVDAYYVYTTEGNTSSDAGVVENGGCVAQKKYKKNYSKIAGYGRPDYSIVERGMTMAEYENLQNIIIEQSKKIKALEIETEKLKNAIGGTFIYNYIDDNMPDWAKPTIQKLVNKGFLKGDENGLNLNNELLRILVIHDRAGLYD